MLRLLDLFTRLLYLVTRLQLWRVRLLTKLWPSPKLRQQFAASQLPILISQGADWREIVPCLEIVDKHSYRVNMLRLAVGTYWRRGQFDDARNAADYWSFVMKEQASPHRQEFREALQIVRRTSTWHLGRPGGEVQGIDEFAVYRGFGKKRGALVKDYRDAHLAQAYLKWSGEHGDAAAKEYLCQNQSEIRVGFLDGAFVLEARLAKELGIPMEVFDRMRKEAEKLSNLPVVQAK